MSEKTEPVEFTAAEQAMLILAGGIADEREENRKLRTEIAALTSERDEAVRVATELRAKAALADELLSGDCLIDGSGVETCSHCREAQYGDWKWQRPFRHQPSCIKARYDSLTHTTGSESKDV